MAAELTIGRFRVGELLGTGAFSAVYRAVDDRIGGEVALKLLADHHSLDPDIRERFIAEARLLRRLTSPHVVRLYELDETERHQPFHVLEYVAGGNLAAHRQRMVTAGRRVTAVDVSIAAADLTTALSVLHAERVVHRDLAPKNLLVRHAASEEAGARRPTDGGLFAAGDQLVLADLGISKDLDASSGLTAAAGTVGFAAPEQRRVGIVDERVDVFAASAVLAWLITGSSPEDAVASAVVEAGFDRRLGEVLAAGLSTDPEDRPATIVAWHDGVRAALRPPARKPVVAPDRAPARRAGAAVAVAAALAVGGAGGWWIAGRDDGSASRTTVLDGGTTIRVEDRSGDVLARFDGPSTLTVGTAARFAATVEGTSVWTWYGPGGRQIAGEDEITITPSTSGRLTLRLVATGDDGTATAVAVFDVEP